MRSICALRDRFALIVVASCLQHSSPQRFPRKTRRRPQVEVPRFEPAPCPKLPGAEELAKASCGYLVVLENHSRPTGRTIRLMVAKYPARSPEKRCRSRCLSGRRARRHRAPGGQRAHRCRFQPRPGHPGGEPARHHVLGTGADLRAPRRIRKKASRSPVLFRGDRARPSGGDASLPPGTRRHRRRPWRLQFDRKCRRCRRPPQGARRCRVECLRDFLWFLRGADAHARPPRGHPQRRPQYRLADDLHHPRKLVEHRRRLRQPVPGLRGGNGLQRRLSASRSNLHPTGQQTRGRPADDNCWRPDHRRSRDSRPRRRGTDRLATQPELRRALASGRAGSDRWARRRPPRCHRGDRQGSG